MITVAGEALMDLLVDTFGSVTVHPGGGPFNVARMIATLGGECRFLGALSDDAFGDELRVSLEQVGVEISVPAATSAPTTLAIGKLDGSGSVDYRFYLEGTAAARLERSDVPDDVLESSDEVLLGGLGIVIEPIASTLLGLIPHAPADVTVLLDPNCRPRAIADLEGYRTAVASLLRRVDVVKASVDDLEVLYPDTDAGEAAHGMLTLGPRAIVVTDGPAPVVVHTPHTESRVAVPMVDVVDTVGAGDAFAASFLTWWSDHSLTRADTADTKALVNATTAAVEVAALACTVRGANLPARLEVVGARYARHHSTRSGWSTRTGPPGGRTR
jgi:fructokinase